MEVDGCRKLKLIFSPNIFSYGADPLEIISLFLSSKLENFLKTYHCRVEIFETFNKDPVLVYLFLAPLRKPLRFTGSMWNFITPSSATLS